MEGRYTNNKTKKTIDGRLVYQSKIYPFIPAADDDIHIITETGDRLDTLAYQYYQDSSLWWIIAAANNNHNANIGLMEGTQLRVPQNYIEIYKNFTK